jgi:integrase
MAVTYKNNKWYIVHSHSIIVDGAKKYTHKWIPTNATDKPSAKKEEEKYLDNLSKGIIIDPNLTVFELSKMWMEQHVKSPVKPKAKATQIFYQDRLDTYIIPVIGTKLIRKLSVDDLDRVLIECAEGGGIDTTLRSVYATMSAMFAWGKSKRKIEANLMEYVDRPAVAEREYTLLTAEDIPKFLEAILIPKKFETTYACDQKHMYHTMFLVEFTTALRIDELCGIRETDIDFKNKVLYVRQQVVSPGTNPEFGPAKDRRDKRPDKLPLADTVVKALQSEIEYKAKKKAIAEKKGLSWQEYDLVFTNKTGGPIDSKNLNTRILKSILKAADLPPMKFHELRHSVLTILADLNEDPNAICDLARHADINFLKKTYLHKNVEAQRSVSKRLEEIATAPSDKQAKKPPRRRNKSQK